MFSNCENLNYIKILAENIDFDNCLLYWVNNISNSGTFIKNKNKEFNISVSGIPAGWEVIDEEVPEELE
jgi:hypothetical protein